MRAYSTAVVASALGVDRRWLDALIATGGVEGVSPERQGKSRAIPPRSVLIIAIAMDLTAALGTPLARSLVLAAAVLTTGRHQPDVGIALQVDVSAVERRMAARLNEAVDANPPVPRGRPPERPR